jgi:uncharacterized repeat protein (TIGR02543 family)
MPAHTVTFDPNGGTVVASTAQTGTDGKLASLPIPSREGDYRFDGWFTAKSDGTQITVDTVFAADATIYAHWVYTGSSGDGNPGVVSRSSEIVLPTTPPLAEDSEDGLNPYKDAADADWFHDAVQFVTERGLMNGTAADRFSPGATMTRANAVPAGGQTGGERKQAFPGCQGRDMVLRRHSLGQSKSRCGRIRKRRLRSGRRRHP